MVYNVMWLMAHVLVVAWPDIKHLYAEKSVMNRNMDQLALNHVVTVKLLLATNKLVSVTLVAKLEKCHRCV
jgi:hypothetical protein